MKKFNKSQSTSHSPAKKCRICGDNASAFNFNGLSCESCKSFFRRNANKEQELECQKEGSCLMTIKTRKFCSKCRLDRCFEIGMKKELIFRRKEAKIKSNPCGNDSFLKSELLSNDRSTVEMSSIFPRATNETQFAPLNSYERMKIEEIIGHYKKVFKEEDQITTVVEERNPAKFMLNSNEYGKYTVRCAKNIPAFSNLTMSDKLKMMKNFVIIFFDIRIIYFYDKNSNSILIQQMPEQNECYRVSINLWDKWVSQKFYQDWISLLLKFNDSMMNDRIIRDLLITMALFRPLDNLQSAEFVRYKYLEHYYLLQRYVQVKLKKKERFEKHMKRLDRLINQLSDLIEYSKQFYKTVSPETNEMLDDIFKNNLD